MIYCSGISHHCNRRGGAGIQRDRRHRGEYRLILFVVGLIVAVVFFRAGASQSPP
jgi:hypothetical protein